MSSSTVARVVFALLVASTVGAFFVTQRLKRTPPPIKRIIVTRYIAPKTPGATRVASIDFSLPKADSVTISIVNGNGDEIRRLLDDRHLDSGEQAFRWNGHDSSGRVPPDGVYYARIVLHGQGRAVTSPKGINVVTKPPAARIASVTPSQLRAGSPSPVTVTFRGPADQPATLTVYRTDAGPPHPVATATAAPRSHAITWDALIGGRPAPAGVYAFAVTVVDPAGIRGSWPARLPPTAATAAPGSGLTVAGPAASGPLVPVAAGGSTTVNLSGVRTPVRYSLESVSARRSVARGVATPPSVAVRVPAKAPTGLYELSLTNKTTSVRYPIVVQGAHPDRRMLLVVPAITWQALNPVDSDGDGFGDTLENTGSVSLTRPFAGGREPAGFATQAAPLVRLLDGRRLGYDVTTDLALEQGQGPNPAGYKAVVLAGNEPWTTAALLDQLRGYVTSGGHVALFGAANFSHPVKLASSRATLAGSPTANPLGERTSASSSELAPLVVSGDDLGLFSDTSGYLGLFTTFEQTDALDPGAHQLAAAGREPGHPAFVVYTLGSGLVARVGTAQWSSQLDSDPQVGDVTEKLWGMLSR